MDSLEREELLKLASSHVELQRLLKKHEDYEERIRVIRKRGFLTSFEQQEVQNLKLKKLRGKEQLLTLFKNIKKSPNNLNLNGITANAA